MFPNYRQDPAPSNPNTATQFQQQLNIDSLNQNISILNNNLRSLTSYTHYNTTQQSTNFDLLTTTLKEGFKSIGDSIHKLSKQIEITNKINLYTLSSLNNSSPGLNENERQKRNDEFRKLVGFANLVDSNVLNDNLYLDGSALDNDGSNNNSNSGGNGSGSGGSGGSSNNSNSNSNNNNNNNNVGGLSGNGVHVNRTNSGQNHIPTSNRGYSIPTTNTATPTAPNVSDIPTVAAAAATSRKRQKQHQHQQNQHQQHQQIRPVTSNSVDGSPMVQQLSNPPSSNKPHQQQQQQQQAQQHQQVQQQHHLMQRARRQSSEPTSTEDEPVLKKKKNYKDQEPLYILSQPSKISIAEAWAEYEVGLNGQPSVRQLEQKYKTRWRGGANHTISKQYTNRLNFYKFLEKLEDKELGLKFLEHYCAGNGNKNFRWLQFNMPSEEEFKEYCYSNGR